MENNKNSEEQFDNEKLIEDILNSKKQVDGKKQEELKKSSEEDSSEEKFPETVHENIDNKLEQKEQELDENETQDSDDDENDVETVHNKKKKKKKKKSPGKIIFGVVLSAVILSVAIFLAVTIITVGKDMFGIDKPEQNIVITIPNGANVSQIADILKENGVIENPLAFRVVSKLQKASSYIAGDHVVRPNMAYETIIAELQSDAIQKKVSVDVTFPEGYNLYDCAKLLEDKKVCKAADFIKVFNNSSFGYEFEQQVENSPIKFYKMEGYCFPDTYTFFEDSDPEIVAKKIYARYAEMVNPNIMGRMKDMGLTLDQTMTFASIVQAEAPTKDQMKKVASVFWNRINNSEKYPRLESDPTTKYVKNVIKPNIELRNDAMFIAYDTYQGQGLPPGPICNPGIEAIEAVLYPETTNYYYFCSNIQTKEFFYAKTLAEHEKNLKAAGLK